ncbi:cation:proton antiporter [Acinetobacter sp. c3-l95]|uniref:cation:proton antiporter n=1 Tax=Acinetobacter sp. c3-l95 TaxID=3342804 RepID=UPI0035B967A8
MPLLVQLCITLVLILTIIPLGRRFGLPTLLGYILSGLITGQIIRYFPQFAERNWIDEISYIAVLAFMFILGLQLRPQRMWQTRKEFDRIDIAHVIIMGIITTGLFYLVFELNWKVSVLLGFAFVIPSNMLIKQLLSKSHIKDLITSYDLFNDYKVHYCIAVFLIALLPLFAQHFSVLGLLAYIAITLTLISGLFLLRIYIVKWIEKIKYPHANTLWVGLTFLVIICGLLFSQYFMLSPAIAALAAGIVMADAEFRADIAQSIAPFQGILLSALFTSFGLYIDFSSITHYPWHITDMLVSLIVIKLLFSIVIYSIRKYHTQNLFQASILNTQSGEFAFIILFLIYSQQLIAPEMMSVLSLVIVLSMFITPLLLKGIQIFSNDFEQHTQR